MCVDCIVNWVNGSKTKVTNPIIYSTSFDYRSCRGNDGKFHVFGLHQMCVMHSHQLHSNIMNLQRYSQSMWKPYRMHFLLSFSFGIPHQLCFGHIHFGYRFNNIVTLINCTSIRMKMAIMIEIRMLNTQNKNIFLGVHDYSRRMWISLSCSAIILVHIILLTNTNVFFL